MTQPLHLDGRLADLLDSKKIAMTGVTGFIGEQLLWKVLTDLPRTTVCVLVRPKGDLSARERMLALLGKPIFTDLVTAAGSIEALLDARMVVIEGDLPNVPELPRDLDILIHCAGDVSFDPQIDEAFKTNVIGTRALLGAYLDSLRQADGTLRLGHYVHVSTAYTAGRRRGAIPEAALVNDVDPDVETHAALALAEQVDVDSRSVERLTEFRKEAEREHRKAGHLTTGAATEARRRQWVHDQLVIAGTERARSLGWTDCYTFAKSMGEKIVADLGRDIRVSIVRPAIVESSIRNPYPGWIEGFKMADPLILAYGKGQLTEIPASPDALLDIVACDHVVNATLAVAATKPEPGRPEYYHISSGLRNPLTFRDTYTYVRAYFEEHPLNPEHPVRLPEWKFPGRAHVETLLGLGEKFYHLGDSALRLMPRSQTTRRWAKQLDRLGDQLAFLRRYLRIYAEYLTSELLFIDEHTLALHRSLHPDDVERWGFDTADIDWRHYFADVHVPSIVKPVPELAEAKRQRRAAAVTFKPLSEREPGEPVLAAFDLDGTALASNVVEQYLWTRLPKLGFAERAAEIAGMLGRLPALLLTERGDRSAFLRSVYRRYAGVELAELERLVDMELAERIQARLSPAALARIEEHRAAGDTTILLTGAVRPLTRPLAHLFDVVVAADLATDENGRCTGFLATTPMVGETRAAWLRRYAAVHRIDLDRSHAYGDSLTDRAMLEAVGLPVAVNPDLGLLRVAARKHWSIVDWRLRGEASRKALLGRKSR